MLKYKKRTRAGTLAQVFVNRPSNQRCPNKRPRRPRRGEVWESGARSQNAPLHGFYHDSELYRHINRNSSRRSDPNGLSLLRRPMSGLSSLAWHDLETTPRRLDLGLRGSVASRPHFSGGLRKPGDVKPDDGTGCAVNKSRRPRSFCARSQQANDNNASPTERHLLKPPSQANAGSNKFPRRNSIARRSEPQSKLTPTHRSNQVTVFRECGSPPLA
jgi:hypothetical protein